MAKGLDVGTMYVVSARNENNQVVFRKQRNSFFTLSREDFEDSLGCNSPMVIRKGSEVHVVGDDALRYSNISGSRKSFKRPMAKGVLNPNEADAVGVLQIIIQSVLGAPSHPGEVVAITSPADPLDGSFDTTFHRTVLTRHIKNMGYTPIVLNEALAIVYSENPVCQSEGENVPFSGLGISFGAGMVNIVATWRAQKLLEFSVSRGGDWIDQKVSEVTQIPASRVIKFKEGKYQIKGSYNREHEVKMASALEIYTEDLIRYVMQSFADKFSESDRSLDDPIEIVVAGGTTLVPGFLDLFAEVAGTMDLPFEIRAVRHASNPLCAVANGALIAAQSREKKLVQQVQRQAAVAQPEVRTVVQAAQAAPQVQRVQVGSVTAPVAQAPAPSTEPKVRRIAVASNGTIQASQPAIPEGEIESGF
ncbi:MAG: hypothetical protein AB7F75_03640 [Planctomycetota bacterium]